MPLSASSETGRWPRAGHRTRRGRPRAGGCWWSGFGPGGLSASYHLRLLGHEVEIHEASPLPGGMMRYGIPAYRLPRDAVEGEIERIQSMGVKIVCGQTVDDLDAAMRDGAFDAVFLAVGAQRGKHADIPAGDSARMLDAVTLLHETEDHEAPALGRRVVVYGGGDTAMDAARTARRLGAEDAVVVYRRTRQRMPANTEEVEDAVAEGVQLKWLSTIIGTDGEVLKIERMELDADGFPQPTGEFEELQADSVVLALGQDADLSLLGGFPEIQVGDGVVPVGPGDLTDGPARRLRRGRHGRRVPHLDRRHRARQARRPGPSMPGWRAAASTVRPVTPWLRRNGSTPGTTPTRPCGPPPPRRRPAHLHLRRSRRRARRGTALFEARRCMSCGNCFQCDNCFGVCPDNVVMKVDEAHGYRFDYDFCKGCGLCVQECPCGEIEMVPEEI